MIVFLKYSFKYWFEIKILFFRETENDYKFRHQENYSNFDEAIRKREQEYRSKLDETSSLLFSKYLKVIYTAVCTYRNKQDYGPIKYNMPTPSTIHSLSL